MTGRFHYDWKTGRMKDTQSKSQATKDMRILETIINDACYSYEKKIKELKERIKQQEELISEKEIQVDFLQDENKHMRYVLNKNKQLKKQLDGICKSYSDYYGMNIRNAQWYGFKGDDLDD